MKINYRFNGYFDDEVWEGSFEFAGNISKLIGSSKIIGAPLTTDDAIIEMDLRKASREALKKDHGSQDWVSTKLWVD